MPYSLDYPDFTIADHARGVTFYWEHLGLLDDSGYRTRWERKRAEYLAAGILPYLVERRRRLAASAWVRKREFSICRLLFGTTGFRGVLEPIYRLWRGLASLLFNPFSA